MPQERTYRAGGSIEDYCRACKIDRIHTVIVVDGDGSPVRVACDSCRSEHNYRGGARTAAFGATESGEGRVQQSGPADRPASRARAASAEPFPIVGDRERTAPVMTVSSDDL